jgi:phosphate transport system regulatory protein PhoU
MAIAPADFDDALVRLKERLVQLGYLTQSLLEDAVEVLFSANAEQAAGVIDGDTQIDEEDVAIERAAVELLCCPNDKQPEAIREVLTIVKVNNELERIADCAVNIAEEVQSFVSLPSLPPPTFRVMANSVIGMVRDCVASMRDGDLKLAEVVLHADDAVDEFKKQILRDAEMQLASGVHSVDLGFSLILIATDLERMADHATNIAEQVIYERTGLIVRHGADGWSRRGGRTDHIPACLVYSRGASPQSAITTIVHTLQTTETVMEISIIRERLEAIDQAHVLTYFEELAPAEQHALLEQINDIDLAALPQLIETYVRRTPEIAIPDDLAPAPYYPADPASAVRPYDSARYRKIGEEIIAAGKLAVFTVAGGQGTRLGFDGPKGAFPGSAVTRKPLFQIFAEGIAATQRKYGCTVPWYIMTSPLNDAATRAFFDEHSFFGLDRNNVMFLMQGVMPSFDLETGKLLLAEKGKLATNPDGHGGSLRALFNAGALDDMQARGCEQISYHQVDNPNVKVADPLFVGCTPPPRTPPAR